MDERFVRLAAPDEAGRMLQRPGPGRRLGCGRREDAPEAAARIFVEREQVGPASRALRSELVGLVTRQALAHHRPPEVLHLGEVPVLEGRVSG